jgi:hypothetical protein
LRSIRSAIDAIGLPVEYIISDDASDPTHQALIARLSVNHRVIAPRNQGLGANTNKGLAAARGEFILQLQDDCEFVGQPQRLLDALQILREDHEIGIVQLVSSMEAEVADTRSLTSGVSYVVFRNDQLDHIRESGARPYSDQPHVKRRQFCSDIGPYMEGVPMTTMELQYQKRVANQSRWSVAALGNGAGLFRHLGAERTFNPSVLRARRIAAVESIPLIGRVVRRLRGGARAVRDRLKRPRAR